MVPPFTPPPAQDRFAAGPLPRTTTTAFLRSPFPSLLPPARRHPIPSTPAYTPQPPRNGSSPLLEMPDEVLLCIFSQLQLEDLLRLRRSSSRFTPLAVHPSLHRTLALFALPTSPLPRLLAQHILPSVHHLHLHLFPLPTPSPSSPSFLTDSRSDQPTNRILALLRLIPADQLVSLSLPFSAPFLPGAELGEVLKRIGGRLEKLDLRGSAVEGLMFLEWMEEVGKKNRHGGLRELDLSFTSISALPLPPTDAVFGLAGSYDTCWKALRKLSLASCSTLSANAIGAFLSVLPTNIESLDLSRLDQVSYASLRDMRVTVDVPSSPEPTSTSLHEIKLVGIDHLTRSNIRSLKNHWQSQRLAIHPPPTPSTFSWNAIGSTQPRRVWGEPRTPEPLPLPPASLPRLIPTQADSAWSAHSHGTPDLISRSSTSSATSLSTTQSSFSRVSAISTHSALWSALSQDAEHGMLATPGVCQSKLPENPYLPSRSDPKGRSWSSSYDMNREEDAFVPRRPSASFAPAGPMAKSVNINITHSAILESEDEEGYRMFIGEVAGADTGLPGNHGLGLGLGVAVTMGAEVGLGLFGGMGGWRGSGVQGYAREGEQYLEGLAGI